MVRDAPWRKLGGNVVMIMMLLLVSNNLLSHEYIYYYTPVHFQLAVCPFFYTVSQNKHHRCD